MRELVLTIVRASMVLFAFWTLGILVGEAEVTRAAQTVMSGNGAAVRVTVKPDAVYVERSEAGQHLNHDFLLENNLADDLLLTGVELSVFDDGGRLARRDFINRFSVIDHSNGEFCWFGHLKQWSLRVKRGQAVKQGDILGLIGASGDSLFPHLHYELRTGPGITGVEGLPSYFGGFRRVGSQTLVGRGQLDTGDVVENR